MSDIGVAAEIHWKMLNNLPVTREEFSESLGLVMGDHRGSAVHLLTRDLPEEIADSIFFHQTTASDLRAKWLSTFAVPDSIDVQSAFQFLAEVYDALEEVDEAFANHITPGTTRNKRNHLSDIPTRRPNSKLGWSIQLTTQGHGHYNCIREQLVTGPGDLILLSPDALYDYHRDESCDLWEHQWVYFPQEEHRLRWLQWPEIGPGIYHIHADRKNFVKLQGLFDEVYDTYFDSSELVSALTTNIFEQLLIRCHQLAPKLTFPLMDSRISLVRDYIARNFNQNFTIDTLSGKVGLSPARLSALFKQQTGSTPMRWRDERRMARASQLLLQTLYPVSKIAELVGYSDALYFSRCFSQHLNCSPSAYRDKRREKMFYGDSYVPEND